MLTLRRVRDVGYRAVEFAGHPFGAVEAWELRDVLDSWVLDLFQPMSGLT